jgi:tetratricopeptide (TPR) repeat protein
MTAAEASDMKKYRRAFGILCVGLFFMACKSSPSVQPLEERRIAIEHYNRGNMHLGNFDYDLALEEFTEAIRIDPGYYRAYLRRGYIYYSNQAHNKAIDDYTTAIRIKPDYAEAYFYRGIVHFNNNDFDKAIEDWREVLNIEPGQDSAKRNIGIALRQQELITNKL